MSTISRRDGGRLRAVQSETATGPATVLSSPLKATITGDMRRLYDLCNNAERIHDLVIGLFVNRYESRRFV
jgi:hypothetical protein